PARRLHEARPRLRPPARAPLQLAHLALAARRSDVRRAPRRAQGAWLRHLRGPGPARARALPGRQHGAARARGLRALPRGARRGAGRVTAILLAAGVGKRLLGFSNGRPKCLIEVGGKSLLVRLLEGLAAAGVREAAVVVGFGEDAVRAAVGAGPHRDRPGGVLPGAARAGGGRLRARGRHAVDGDRLPRGRGACRARGAAAHRAVTGAPPIREAIIVAEAGDPLRPVARVPLLVRTILALQRAGVERCTLVGSLSPPADARIRCALTTAPTLTPPADDALRLVIGAGTVIDPALVRDLQA